jgi:hypothetical protein
MTNNIGVKFGTNIDNLSEEMLIALGVCYALMNTMGLNFVVTSGAEPDPVHKTNSLHYSGKAIDIRIREWPKDMAEEVTRRLKKILDIVGFDVVLEGNHIHLEYDPHLDDDPLMANVT